VIRDQLECFLSVGPEDVQEDARPSSPDVLSSDVESLLDLSSRELSALKRLNIKSMSDLISKSESDFLKIANFGQRSLNQMKSKLDDLGLSLALSDKE